MNLSKWSVLFEKMSVVIFAVVLSVVLSSLLFSAFKHIAVFVLLIPVLWVSLKVSRNFKFKSPESLTELKLFSKRNFIVETVIEAKRKGVRLKLDSKKVEKEFYKTVCLKFLTSFAVAVLTALIVVFEVHIVEKSNSFRSLFYLTGVKNFPVKVECRTNIVKGQNFTLTVKSELPGEFVVATPFGKFPLKRQGEVGTLSVEPERSSFWFKVEYRAVGLSREVYRGVAVVSDRLNLVSFGGRVVHRTAGIVSKFQGIQDISIVKGCRVDFFGTASREVERAVFFVNRRKFRANVKGNNFSFSLHPDVPYSVRFVLTDRFGSKYESSEFLVKVSTNAKPSIRIKFPNYNPVIPSSSFEVQFVGEFEDDSPISRISAVWLVSNATIGRIRSVGIKPFMFNVGSAGDFKFTFTDKIYKPLVGDRIFVSFMAKDIFGASGTSKYVVLVFPSLAELHRLREKYEKEIVSSVKDFGREVKKLTSDELDRMPYDEQKRFLKTHLERTLKKLQEIEGRVKNVTELSRKLESSERVMKNLKRLAQLIEQMREDLPTESFVKKIDKMDSFTIDKLVDELRMRGRSFEEAVQEAVDIVEYLKKIGRVEMMRHISKSAFRDFQIYKQTRDKDWIKSALKKLSKLKKLSDRVQMSDLDRKELKSLIDSAKTSLGKVEAGGGDVEEAEKKLREVVRKVEELSEKAQGNIVESQANTLLNLAFECAVMSGICEDAKMFIQDISPDSVSAKEVGRKFIYRIRQVSAVSERLAGINRDLRKGIAGLVFEGSLRSKILSYPKKAEKFINDGIRGAYSKMFWSAKVKFHQAGVVLSELSKELMLLSFNLKQMAEMMKRSGKGGAGKRKMLTLGLEGITKIQSQVSAGLEELMKELRKSGKMTPEIEKAMEELEELQRQISEELERIYRAGGTGAGTKELMKNLKEKSEELRKRISEKKLDKKTLSMSKKLEEKLRQAKKGIISKGISPKRKSETARSYKVVPPKSVEVWKDFSQKVPRTGLSRQELQMIERFKRWISD